MNVFDTMRGATLTNVLLDAQTTSSLRSRQQNADRPEFQTARQPTAFRETERSREESFRKEFLQTQAPELLGNYADPLEPMRERDLEALAQWFHREDMLTMETDINQMLLHLLPEPCWEENPFDFLNDFL
jgi:hypothetical protein